ncbi:MAG TPA: alkaline phosphatase family protein, partial [Kofleriaceae bacterium]|nr:alkaline phosphatase family protein [Kofleriaceae bacterium]
MRSRILALAIACVLAALAWQLPALRRRLIHDIVFWDATPSEPVELPAGTGPGLPPAARTRVVLVDGLSAEAAARLAGWQAACARGVHATVDVGFPTVSLPIEAALWSGLTQQQTGIVNRYERPLEPALRGIPSRVEGSWAIAEDHGWIVRSLGFAITEPAADPGDPRHVRDAAPEAWRAAWHARATAAVLSPTPLVFVHVLAVDTAGHQHGGDSAAYRAAAADADRFVTSLVATAPDARWFLLSDHGHLPGGGHGGEERELRQVEGCVVGPDIAPRRAGLLHLVDISRAIADSTGVALDPAARGRPWPGALANPLGRDDAMPTMALGDGALAALVLAIGLALTIVTSRAWWLAPWWFVLGCLALVMVRGEPTLSSGFVYKPAGRDMYLVWLPLLPLACAAIWFGTRRTTVLRAVIAQLALPFAALATALTASGAWA